MYECIRNFVKRGPAKWKNLYTKDVQKRLVTCDSYLPTYLASSSYMQTGS